MGVTASLETADARRLNHDELKQTEQVLATDKAEGALPRCNNPRMTLYTNGNRGKKGGGPPGCYMCSDTAPVPRTKVDSWERCYKPGKQCGCPMISQLVPWPTGPLAYVMLAGPGHPEATGVFQWPTNFDSAMAMG